MHVRSENLQIMENCSIVCESPIVRLLVSKESATFYAERERERERERESLPFIYGPA